MQIDSHGCSPTRPQKQVASLQAVDYHVTDRMQTMESPEYGDFGQERVPGLTC